jgi:hypothetical protein
MNTNLNNGDGVQYVTRATIDRTPRLISWPAVVTRARLDGSIDVLVTPTSPNDDRGTILKPFRATQLPRFDPAKQSCGWLPLPGDRPAVALEDAAPATQAAAPEQVNTPAA